jgi:hypothetical protein
MTVSVTTTTNPLQTYVSVKALHGEPVISKLAAEFGLAAAEIEQLHWEELEKNRIALAAVAEERIKGFREVRVRCNCYRFHSTLASLCCSPFPRVSWIQ